MGHKQRERQRKRELKEQVYIKSLVEARAKVVVKEPKRLTFDQILQKFPLIGSYRDWFIRDVSKWKSRSYNLQRQYEDFIKFVFCKYPIPDYFLSAFKTKEEALIRSWFISASQGDSFRKIAKDYFTAKEAHLFLHAPFPTVVENAWWAKCKVHNWPTSYIKLFIEKVTCNPLLPKSGTTVYWDRVILLFSNFLDQLDLDTLGELLDFLRVQNVFTFVLEGRTLASLIRLSNEWHKQQHKRTPRGNFKWDGLNTPDWEYKETINNTKTIWTISQLKTAYSLFDEGRVQKHCVGSYTYLCEKGTISIFTMHSVNEQVERKHVTIEVENSSRRIRQKRGKLNRMPTPHEDSIITKWANTGLKRIDHYETITN